MALAAGQTGHLADHQEGVYQVSHGATAGTSRPTLGSASTAPSVVLWNGTVEPTNAVNGDLWWDETNSLVKVKVSGSFVASGSGTYAPLSKVAAALRLDEMVAWDTFNRADGAIGTADSGQSWTAYNGGTWSVSSNLLGVAESNTRVVALDSTVSDGAAEMSFSIGAGSLVGVVFRLADASNYLMLEVSSSAFRIQKRDSGSNTLLTSGSAVSLSSSEVYRLTVRFIGDAVAGELRDMSGRSRATVTHTLSGADQTKYGSNTRHGLLTFNASAARFDNFVVRGPLV